MTQDQAIKIATQYQKERDASVRVSAVRRIRQDQIDALLEAEEAPPSERPAWMRPAPHWVVLFERERKMIPTEDVISVYDDGFVTDMPIM